MSTDAARDDFADIAENANLIGSARTTSREH
jgi:hypothetical protein